MIRARRSRALQVTALCLAMGSIAVITSSSVRAHSRPRADQNPAAASTTPAPVMSGTTALRVGADVVDGAGASGLTNEPGPSTSVLTPNPPPVPSDVDESSRPQLRVLLIGNSYTLHHTLHSLLQRLAASVAQGPKVSVEQVAHGGYSLRSHWRGRLALAKIRSGRYTHVVLQGHSLSALDHREELEADAERFKQAIDAAAGHTVFYATWARSPEARIYLRHPAVHSFEQMSQLVATTYSDISTRLGAGLAPVGRAFERALVKNPKLSLWGADGSHPTLAGSYLAACVLYATISGGDPRDAEYVPPGMNESDAIQIRDIAAESISAKQPMLAGSPAANETSL